MTKARSDACLDLIQFCCCPLQQFFFRVFSVTLFFHGSLLLLLEAVYNGFPLTVTVVLVSGAKQAVETTQDQECEVKLVVKYINEVENKL
ncbi:hypothetical protein KSD_65590 [Ktedonobacter sp. SOSP1-85]|nr:hypothetical protein KSD_65590 [Ktedonobacter sp. SOSP1-85]